MFKGMARTPWPIMAGISFYIRILKLKITSLAAVFFLASSTAFANNEDEKSIFHESELRDWCKTESFRHFKSRHTTPYNWTSKWWNKGNMLYAKGQWKIKGRKVKVNCHLRKGGKAKYAEMVITGEDKL